MFRLIRWFFFLEEWIKINCDVVFVLGFYVGVVKNEVGSWIVGFCKSGKVTDAYVVEFIVIREGLNLCV